MTATNHLYQLICSLTPSEKRYFKLFAQRHSVSKKNNYEKLFDAFEKWCEPYDEKAFCKMHRSKPFIKNFAEEKRRLEELIMSAMRSFHSASSIHSQIFQLLVDDEFCEAKRLKDQRRKILAAAKKLATEYEEWLPMLRILQREITMRLEDQQENMEEHTLKIEAEINQVLEQVRLTSTFRQLSDRLFALVRIHFDAAGKKTLHKAQEIIDRPEIKNFETGKYFCLDTLYHKIWSSYHRLDKNYQEINNHRKAVLDCYQKHPQFIAAHSLSYKIAIFNYLNSCFAVQNYAEVERLLNIARKLPCKSFDEEGENWQNIVHVELMYRLNKFQFAEAAAMESEILEGLKKYTEKVNIARKLTLYSNLQIAFFVLKKWDKALDYLNLIIEDKSEARRDTRWEAECLLLPVHFEKSNYSLVSCGAHNLIKRFAKNDFANEHDIAVLRHLEKLSNLPPDKQKPELKKMLDLMQSLNGAAPQLLTPGSLFYIWTKGCYLKEPLEKIWREEEVQK